MTGLLYSDNWGSEEAAEVLRLEGPILILGASGFIGSKLFFSLNQYRDDVFGCSSNIKNSWRFKYGKWNNLENVDITNYTELEKLAAKIKPRIIFNLSAYDGQSEKEDVERIHLVNYLGTLNVLRVLSAVNCLAFVGAGSSSEYGLNGAAPTEKDEFMPNSDYAVSKIGASYLIKYYGKIIGLPIMHLRLYSIFGPWDKRKRFIPVLVSKCLENQWPNFAEKEISHDFVYVDDCTNAFVKAALCLCDKRGFGEAVNIATGIKTTMGDLAEAAKRVFKITQEPQFGTIPNKKWDILNWYGNPKLAHQILRWHPRTSLGNGLRLLAEWEKEFKKTA